MIDCPISYFEQNLIFDKQKTCWAAFKLVGFTYDNQSEDSKQIILQKLTQLIAAIVSEAKILIVPSTLNFSDHFAKLKKALSPKDPLYRYATSHADYTQDYLETYTVENGSNVNHYDTFLLVNLTAQEGESPLTKIKDGFAFLLKEPKNAIDLLMNTDYADILESKMQTFADAANRFLDTQFSRVAMHPATSEEVQYLFRRSCYRGLESDIEITTRRSDPNGWAPFAGRKFIRGGKDVAISPYQRDVTNLFRGVISTKPSRCLTVTHDDGSVSYQTYMVLTHLRDEIDFPGMEWIYQTQSLNVQAEVCVYIKNIPHYDAMKRIDAKKTEVNAQIGNAMEASQDPPRDLEKSRLESQHLEDALTPAKHPICQVCVSFCLFGTDPEVIERKAEHVKKYFVDKRFAVERPLTDQLKFFLQHLPGTGLYTKDFQIMIPPQTLAGGIFGVTTQLGDSIGPYIGTTGKLNVPVFLWPGEACLTNKSASMTFYGNLGYGKSFAANLLAVLNVIYGGKSLIIDPKGERSEWIERLTMMRGLINIATLEPSPENRGKLDPFIMFAEDFDNAKELAIIMAVEALSLPSRGREFTALLEAAEKLRRVKNPCMLKLCEMLEKFPSGDSFAEKAHELGRQIRGFSTIGVGILFCGNGTEKAISLSSTLTIVQIQNMKLPSPTSKKDDFTLEERLSSTAMIALGTFAKKFARSSPGIFKIVLFDESWMLGKTAEGVKLFDTLARMGRQQFTGCIFNGHSVDDIPDEGIKNTITYKFCFHTGETTEARKMAEYLGLEQTQNNIDALMSLENGECFFRDMVGRVGKLHFDAVFDDIIRAFQTTPKPQENEAAAESPAEIEDTAADLSGDEFAEIDLFKRETV